MLKIAHTQVGPGHKPFIIAEMSGNHNQSLQRALALVDAAADAGVDALKIQTYTADTMTLNVQTADFVVDDPHGLWKGKTLYELYQQAYTPWEWHAAIFKRCAERGIIGFSSPFDESAVDFLETLDVPLYKIASFENTDVPLIKRIARTGKPVIASTGMASLKDIELLTNTLRENGCNDFVLLKCTSTYPASPLNTNLLTMPHMGQAFHCLVGLSDHTMGIGVSVAAVALGACVIEKHFTLQRSDGGVDAAFSLEPDELALLVSETEKAWQALGQVSYQYSANEQKMALYKRSIYAAKDIAAGEEFNRENIRVVRPGKGLAPKHYEDILKKKSAIAIAAGTAIDWCMLAN